jgi:hypothetical protein
VPPWWSQSLHVHRSLYHSVFVLPGCHACALPMCRLGCILQLCGCSPEASGWVLSVLGVTCSSIASCAKCTKTACHIPGGASHYTHAWPSYVMEAIAGVLCVLSHVAASLCGVLYQCSRYDVGRPLELCRLDPPSSLCWLLGQPCSSVSAQDFRTVKKRENSKKQGGYRQRGWRVQAQCTELSRQ